MTFTSSQEQNLFLIYGFHPSQCPPMKLFRSPWIRYSIIPQQLYDRNIYYVSLFSLFALGKGPYLKTRDRRICNVCTMHVCH